MTKSGAVQVTPIQTVQFIELSAIEPSPTNPRKYFDKAKLNELATTIRTHGVLEPAMVRRHPTLVDTYELIFGERRWRGSKIAGVDLLPCLVREASDQEVLELQMTENVDREDLQPMEEAEACREWHEKFGVPVTAISERLGKSPTWVYGRIQLCQLGPDGRKAFLEGKLLQATALMVSRIPAKLQPEAVKQLLQDYKFDGAPKAAEHAGQHIQDHFMLRLADAPFDRGDAELVAKAGACTVCPKRTGNQTELFPDVKSPDMCTDPTCYGEKRDVAWERKKAEAATNGIAVLSDKQAKTVFQGSHIRHDGAFVDLKEMNWTDPKQRTWGQLLGKQKPPITLARDEDGNTHELVDKKSAGLALKKIGGAAANLAPSRNADPHTLKMQRDSAVRRSAANKALALLVVAGEKKGPALEVMRLLVIGLITEVWADRVKAIVERRELQAVKAGSSSARTRPNAAVLAEAASKMALPKLIGLAVELVASRDAYSIHNSPSDDAIVRACKELRVDWAKCQAEARAERAAKEKPAKTKKSPTKKAKRQ